VKKDLWRNWRVQNAIQLFTGSTLLVKNDDNNLGDYGIYDGAALFVMVMQAPDKMNLFVTLPGESNPTIITLNEVMCISSSSVHVLLRCDCRMQRAMTYIRELRSLVKMTGPSV